MTGLVVAAVVLAAGFYVALRRVTPVGVGLNPWRYIARLNWRQRWERNLPEPGTSICDADPPADLIRELNGRYVGFIGLTRCYMPHGALPRGGAHVGLVVADSRDGFGPLYSAYTWLELRTEPVRRPRRRDARWRRWLIRLATPTTP